MKIKTKIVSCHTPDSKPVKQEINGTVVLPPLVFPAYIIRGALYNLIFVLLKMRCSIWGFIESAIPGSLCRIWGSL